jgi:hypothetical protein
MLHTLKRHTAIIRSRSVPAVQALLQKIFKKSANPAAMHKLVHTLEETAALIDEMRAIPEVMWEFQRHLQITDDLTEEYERTQRSFAQAYLSREGEIVKLAMSTPDFFINYTTENPGSQIAGDFHEAALWLRDAPERFSFPILTLSPVGILYLRLDNPNMIDGYQLRWTDFSRNGPTAPGHPEAYARSREISLQLKERFSKERT